MAVSHATSRCISSAPWRPSICVSSASRRPAGTRCRHLTIVAFKDGDALAADWRISKMTDSSKQLFGPVMSRGDMQLADTILDEHVVYRDNMFWGPGLLVGRHKFKELVEDTRFKYPDVWYQIDQMSMQDANHVWVAWTGHGTHLQDATGAASLHNSSYSGVSVVSFNDNRSRINEVSVFRQPTAEEKAILLHGQDNNPYEIKLARLHLEPAAAEAPSAASATSSGGEGGAKHHHGGGSSQGGSGRRLSTAETA